MFSALNTEQMGYYSWAVLPFKVWIVSSEEIQPSDSVHDTTLTNLPLLSLQQI